MDDVENMQIETLSYLSVAQRNRFHTDKNRLIWRLGLVPAVPRYQRNTSHKCCSILIMLLYSKIILNILGCSTIL